MLAPLLALVLASPGHIAVLPVMAGEGVTDKTATALTEALAAEVRKRSGAEVITQREINAVLTLERQRSMLGCTTDACMAELGGALGVERLVNGDVARVGESLLVHFRLLEVERVRVVAQSDRRLRKGTLDDLLDALPAMVGELFLPGEKGLAEPGVGAAPQKRASQGETGSAPGPRPAQPRTLPPPWAEEPERVDAQTLSRLGLWEDGSGAYLAVDPADLDGPVFAGTSRKLHRIRIGGGSQNGAEQTGDRFFWEPRAGGRASFSYTPTEAHLSCGRREIPLKRVPALEARKLLSRAELLAPRWRRIPHLLARDDEGTYFYVDGARRADGEAAEVHDYRLYVGRKGSLARIDLLDAIEDQGGLVFLTSGGRLLARPQGRSYAVEWAASGTRIALTFLDPADEGPLIYRELGVYAGEKLGTPCDERF